MNKNIIIGLFLLANGQISHGMEHAEEQQYKPRLTKTEIAIEGAQIATILVGLGLIGVATLESIPSIFASLQNCLCETRSKTEIAQADKKISRIGKEFVIAIVLGATALGTEFAKNLAMPRVCLARNTFADIKCCTPLIELADQLTQNNLPAETETQILSMVREIGDNPRQHGDGKELQRAVTTIQDLISRLNAIEQDKGYYIEWQAYDNHIPKWISLLTNVVAFITNNPAYERRTRLGLLD